MLRPLGRELWVAERPQRAFGAVIGARMTVVRLEDGGLWLHSPLPPDPPLLEALAALGPVAALVAPTLQQNPRLAEAAAAWPEAELYLAPEPAERQSAAAVLGDQPPPRWRHQIDQVPFRGAPRLGEVAFFHRESKTLLLAELAFNFRPGGAPDLWTRLVRWAQGVDRGFTASPALRRGLEDAMAARASADRLLRWDFERITVCHGEVLEEQARMRLAEALSWI